MADMHELPPLTGMVQQTLDLVSEWPTVSAPPHYVPRFWVKLEVEFIDQEAAERFEEKVRKLLTHDNMQVLYSSPGPSKTQ
jgi:hypothetical protein